MVFGFLYKEKYKVHFLKNYREVKQKSVNISKNSVTIGKNQYPITDADISYKKNNTNHIFIDYEKGSIMKIGENTATLNTSLIDLIMSTKVLRDLASKFNPTTNFGGIGLIIILILFGLAFGYILGNMFNIESIQNAIRNIQLPHW